MEITVEIHGKKSIIDNYDVKQFSIESCFLCVKHTNTLEQALRFCLNDAQRRYVDELQCKTDRHDERAEHLLTKMYDIVVWTAALG